MVACEGLPGLVSIAPAVQKLFRQTEFAFSAPLLALTARTARITRNQVAGSARSTCLVFTACNCSYQRQIIRGFEGAV